MGTDSIANPCYTTPLAAQADPCNYAQQFAGRCWKLQSSRVLHGLRMAADPNLKVRRDGAGSGRCGLHGLVSPVSNSLAMPTADYVVGFR